MHYVELFFQHLLHLDIYLTHFIQTYGAWAYALLFIILFCETGLVFTPFLPGDSLLFAAGAMAAHHLMAIDTLILVLAAGALLGDQTNYGIGRYLGHRLLLMQDRWFFKKAYLQRTHTFYEKHGGKTLIIARFVPIIRTFAPFAAGLSRMRYFRFCVFSIAGGIGWVTSVTLAGFLFSNIPLVKNNFTAVVLAIIALSLMPGVFEYFRARRRI